MRKTPQASRVHPLIPLDAKSQFPGRPRTLRGNRCYEISGPSVAADPTQDRALFPGPAHQNLLTHPVPIGSANPARAPGKKTHRRRPWKPRHNRILRNRPVQSAALDTEYRLCLARTLPVPRISRCFSLSKAANRKSCKLKRRVSPRRFRFSGLRISASEPSGYAVYARLASRRRDGLQVDSGHRRAALRQYFYDPLWAIPRLAYVID